MVPYLRVVVTTRCPLACPYCHAEGDHAGPAAGGLPRERLVPILAAAVAAGVRKLKFLGGEPLLRPDLPELVAAVAALDPTVDLSLITSGAAPLATLDACFAAGLHRANLSIHGWTPSAFGARRGGAVQFDRRAAILARLLDLGRPLKLNYVYAGVGPRPPASSPPDVAPVRTDEEADLDALLDFAAGRPLVVGLLDDLGRPELGPEAVRAVLRRLRGPPRAVLPTPDPHSLPTETWAWDDGLRVEVKSERLGHRAPWRACDGCALRARCGEGIDAIRLGHDGRLRACMDRPQLGLSLLEDPPEALPGRIRAWVAAERA